MRPKEGTVSMAGVSTLVRIVRSAATGALLGATGRAAGRLRPLEFGALETALGALGPERANELDELVTPASVADLGAMLDAGTLTASDLVLHYLDRIRRLDAALNAIVELNPEVLAEAAASDQRRAEGRPRGPLDGIPVTLKDNIETAGPLHTTGGAVVLADHVATRDAPIVVSLREAGAVILGKANLSELAGVISRVPGVSAVGGQTANPYGAAFSPGGSSSGSAVAVGAGLCAISVGTETSGSLIAPAAFNGLVGMKPSRGVLSGEGIIPLIRFQDSPGPVARSVADAATLLHGMGGPEIELSTGALGGAVAGVLSRDILSQRAGLEDPSDNPHLLELVRAGLVGAGADVVEVTIDAVAMKGYEASFLRVTLGGLAHDTMGYLARSGAPATTLSELADFNLAEPRVRMPRGQQLLALAMLLETDRATYEDAAVNLRRRATAILNTAFEARGCTVLVSLSNLHSSLYATAGFPAVTVPLGLRRNGMPAGVTLIGRLGEDARLLGFAHALERCVGPRVAPALPA